MGPIERDLREQGVRWWRLESRGAFEVWLGARQSLGLPPFNSPAEGGAYQEDVASEAIEAAAALGL